MKQDERAPFVEALQAARLSAYAAGEFVEQESFMRAGEILALARQAGVAPGASVLDLCCGIAGPGRFITQKLGCSYLGVDLSSSALDIARERAGDLPCRFEVSRIPPVPPGPFDFVLLFETMLAFPEKEPLLREISQALTSGGRLAFTMEEGLLLTETERGTMPDADTVRITPAGRDAHLLTAGRARCRWQDDQRPVPPSRRRCLDHAFAASTRQIAAQIGHRALEELLTAHRLWSDWLREGRVRKIAFVAENCGGATRARHRGVAAQLTAFKPATRLQATSNSRLLNSPQGGLKAPHQLHEFQPRGRIVATPLGWRGRVMVATHRAGEASSAGEAVALAYRLRPDVVLIDAALSEVDGIEVTRQLTSQPDVAVMLLTSSDHTDDTLALLRAGATGMLLKDTEPAELARHVEALARGEAQLTPRLTHRLITASPSWPRRLTARHPAPTCSTS